jgi:hypothetical protein
LNARPFESYIIYIRKQMKKVSLIALVLMGTAFAGYSQSEENKPERIKLVPSGHTSTNVEVSKVEQIKKCENQIEALNAKEAIILQDAEETKIAKESGWFTNAAKQRVELKAKIQELKK